MKTVLKYILRDLVRSRFLAGYALFFFAISEVFIRLVGFEGAVLALLEIGLALVPLITIIFTVVYLYDAQKMAEMLLAQPLSRTSLTLGLYCGLIFATCLVPVISVALPFLARGYVTTTVFLLLGSIAVLAAIFTSISFAIASSVKNKLQGLVAGIFVWLFLLVIYDGLLLLGLHFFSAYPLERPVIAGVFLNPIDLCRTLVLLHTDVGAMMGYTGAVFQQFLGSAKGVVFGVLALVAWTVIPFAISFVKYAKKDY